MAEKKKIVRLADVGELENILKKDLAEEEAKGKDADTLFCEDVAGELTDLESLPTIDPERIIPAWRDDYLGITTAHYEDGNVFSEDSAWYWEDLPDWGTYDEERDDYRIPEGWWEYRHFNPDDVYNNKIDCPVVGWMPMQP